MCLRAKLLQSCPTLCDPMDCSLPSSSVHGIHQARILECVVIPFFSSLPLAAPGKPKALYVCLVAQSCPTLCNPMDCNLPDTSVHGYSPSKNTGVDCHALIAMPSSRGSSQSRNQTEVSCITSRFFTD